MALKVDADYAKAGARTLALTFQEAKVSEVRISDLAEAVIAPALLPRTPLSHQILLAIKELELKFPLRGAVTAMGGPGGDSSSKSNSSKGDSSNEGSTSSPVKQPRSGGAAVDESWSSRGCKISRKFLEGAHSPAWLALGGRAPRA